MEQSLRPRGNGKGKRGDSVILRLHDTDQVYIVAHEHDVYSSGGCRATQEPCMNASERRIKYVGRCTKDAAYYWGFMDEGHAEDYLETPDSFNHVHR